MHGERRPGLHADLAYPKTPFYPSNATTNPYPFSMAIADERAEGHGWNVIPKAPTSARARAAVPGECGAGIPAGTKLTFNLIYNSVRRSRRKSTDLASNAKQAGIKITLQGSNFNYMIRTTTTRVAREREQVGAQDFGGEDFSPYPTTFGFLNTNGSDQIGNYSNPTADSLINDSITSPNPAGGHERTGVLRDQSAGAVASRSTTTPGPGRRTSRRPSRKRSRT